MSSSPGIVAVRGQISTGLRYFVAAIVYGILLI